MAEREDTTPSSWFDRHFLPVKESFTDLKRRFWSPREMKPVDPSERIEAIIELSRVLGRDHVLDQPTGPTDDCFSARRWSDFLYDGLFGAGLDHLLGCSSCRSTSASVDVPQIPPPHEFAKRALEMANGRQTAATDRPTGSRPLTGILARSSRRVPVRTSHGTEISLKFFPAFDLDMRQLKTFDLRVAGALTAPNVAIDRNDDPHAPRLTFHAALSPQLRTDLTEHASATGRVEIAGAVDGQRLAAQCSLEFQNADLNDE